MDINFYKIQFAKNDLIVANFLHSPPPGEEEKQQLSYIMCKRHSGIGGNGLIFLLPGKNHTLKIELFRPSGEKDSLLFDGLFCSGRFAFDFGLVENETITIESGESTYKLTVIDSNNLQINIGKPFFMNSGEELKEEPDKDYNTIIAVENKRYAITPIQLAGRNFGIHFPGEFNKNTLKDLSLSITEMTKGEESFQPVFSQIFSREEMSTTVWMNKKRIDFCSAAGAACIASVINGFSEREVLLHMNGEDLFIQWNNYTNNLLVTGTPKYVFAGTYYTEI